MIINVARKFVLEKHEHNTIYREYLTSEFMQGHMKVVKKCTIGQNSKVIYLKIAFGLLRTSGQKPPSSGSPVLLDQPTPMSRVGVIGYTLPNILRAGS